MFFNHWKSWALVSAGRGRLCNTAKTLDFLCFAAHMRDGISRAFACRRFERCGVSPKCFPRPDREAGRTNNTPSLTVGPLVTHAHRRAEAAPLGIALLLLI